MTAYPHVAIARTSAHAPRAHVTTQGRHPRNPEPNPFCKFRKRSYPEANYDRVCTQPVATALARSALIGRTLGHCTRTLWSWLQSIVHGTYFPHPRFGWFWAVSPWVIWPLRLSHPPPWPLCLTCHHCFWCFADRRGSVLSPYPRTPH